MIPNGGRQNPGENSGFWMKFVTELERSQDRPLHITCVKEHAEQVHINKGHNTEMVKGGNDAADALASTAASRHGTPQAAFDWKLRLLRRCFAAVCLLDVLRHM